MIIPAANCDFTTLSTSFDSSFGEDGAMTFTIDGPDGSASITFEPEQVALVFQAILNPEIL